MRRPWTPEETRELVARYPAEGAAGLVATLERSPDSIDGRARRYGIRSRTRRLRQAQSRAERSTTVDARFFDESTPSVAYVLGVVWACGSVKTKHRSVLRLACHTGRLIVLERVLTLLGSRHQVQRQYGGRPIVEVCNSRLVRSLLDNFGRPPGRHTDGALPSIDESLIPAFARGHLDGTGYERVTAIRWTGHPKVVEQLATQLREAAGVGEPRTNRLRRDLSIAWTDTTELRRIRAWVRGPTSFPVTETL